MTQDIRLLTHKNIKVTALRILPFATTYHPAVKKLKQVLMENWRFIENQPTLKTIATEAGSDVVISQGAHTSGESGCLFEI